jgi:hypothetical protein
VDPLHIVLHGVGVEDKEPIALVKAVPWIHLSDIDLGYETISFDDDRDQPMRDAIITHIGVGAGYIHNGDVGAAANAWRLHDLQFRPHAPEGPGWHTGEFFPLALVAEQVAAVNNGYQFMQYLPTSVRHRPVTPYVLHPGERFTVDLWNRTDRADAAGYTGQSTLQDLHVDVALIGRQEVD